MEKWEKQADNPNTIIGDTFVLEVANIEEIAKLTQNADRPYFILCHDDETLPYPLDAAEISIDRMAKGDSHPNLYGSVCFPADPEIISEDWHETQREALQQTIGDTLPTLTLAHDFSSLYIVLDSHRTMRITYVANAADCGFEARIVSTSSLDDGIENMPSVAELQPLDLDKIILRFIRIYAAALDEITRYYGEDNPSELAHLQAAAPESTRMSSDLTALATSIGVVANRQALLEASPLQNAPMPPAIEMQTRANTLDSLGGLEQPKRRLKEIARDFKQPEAARLYGISPTHFLLHGPPGTGKTSLVEALASETGAELVTIPSSQVISKWVGQSPQNLDKIFKKAYEKEAPQILFFDEIDTFAASGKTNHAAAYSEVQRRLQQFIIEVSSDHPEIIIAAATNSDIDDIVPALTRSGRLEPISVGLPDQPERQDIWATIVAERYSQFDNKEWQDGRAQKIEFRPYQNIFSYDYPTLAAHSEDMTAADFKEILNQAQRECYNHYLETGERLQVSNEQLFRILKNFYRR